MRTRRIIIGALAAALLVPAVAPEAAHALDVTLGPKIGLNFGWIGGSDFSDSLRMLDDQGRDRRSARIGVSAGLALSVGFMEYFAIQPELLYSSLGGRYEYTFTGIEVDGVMYAGAVEIPVYLKPRIPVGDGAVYLLFGPDLFLILTDVTSKEESGTVEAELDTPADNTAVFGISGGLGYEHSVGPGRITFEARYGITLTEIFDDDNSSLSALSVMVGYGFDLTGGGG